MNDNTGGPAFPCMAYQAPSGMTLRDYFAAKAMQAWLSTYPENLGPDEVYAGGVAELAYEVADAMLRVRQE